MLPQLYDVDDLPDPAYDPNYVHVLSDKEQADLHKRTCARPVFSEHSLLILSLCVTLEQVKFRESQTWYRPHGTETHRVSILSHFGEMPILMSNRSGISNQVHLLNFTPNYLIQNIPDRTALLICLFIDGNSFFQIILCGTMWGLNR